MHTSVWSDSIFNMLLQPFDWNIHLYSCGAVAQYGRTLWLIHRTCRGTVKHPLLSLLGIQH